LFYFDGENGVGGLCFEGDPPITKKRSSTFWRKKVHPSDMTGGFSDWVAWFTVAFTVLGV